MALVFVQSFDSNEHLLLAFGLYLGSMQPSLEVDAGLECSASSFRRLPLDALDMARVSRVVISDRCVSKSARWPIVQKAVF